MILDRQFLSVPTSKPFYGSGLAYSISTRERSSVQDGATRPRASRRRDRASTNELVLTRDCVSMTDHASDRGRVKDLVPDRDSESWIDSVSEKSPRTTKESTDYKRESTDYKRESTDYKIVYGL